MAADTPFDCPNTINLTLFSGTGSIWNAFEWKKLRKHRIVGTFIGNIAHQPHQTRENGLPLLLTKNETTLLIENQLALLWDCPHLMEEPGNNMSDLCRAQMSANFAEQSELLMEQRKQEILEKIDVIVTGKLSKRRKLNSTGSAQEERDAIIQAEIAKIKRPDQQYLLLQTCTEDPWPKEQKAAKWTYPNTESEKLEYQTFKALWEAGHWVTPAAKFGGHFLAYPGDPILYHAHYIVQLTTLDAKISPTDIVAITRLANSTKKTALLAYFDLNGTIEFQSLSWTGE